MPWFRRCVCVYPPEVCKSLFFVHPHVRRKRGKWRITKENKKARKEWNAKKKLWPHLNQPHNSLVWLTEGPKIEKKCHSRMTAWIRRGEVGAYKGQAYPKVWGQQTGTSPEVFPPPKKLFKTRDLELPFFEGSLPSCSPHSVGYTRTLLHPYFPVANWNLAWLLESDIPHPAAKRVRQKESGKKGTKRVTGESE